MARFQVQKPPATGEGRDLSRNFHHAIYARGRVRAVKIAAVMRRDRFQAPPTWEMSVDTILAIAILGMIQAPSK